jgi:carboxyl-terminal processing protease
MQIRQKIKTFMNIPKISLLLIYTLSSLFVFGQAKNNIQQEGIALYSALQKYHFSPKKCDDALASQVFQLFLKELDPSAMVLTQEDVKTLSQYEKSIDEDLQGKSWVFLPAATELFQKRLRESLGMMSNILETTFDYSINESVAIPKKKTSEMPDFEKDTAAQRKKLYLNFKYSVLRNMVGRAEEKMAEAEILASQTKVREHILKKRITKMNNILNHQMGFENYLAEAFFNSLTNAFDPHSMYLSKAHQSLFMKGVSKDSYTYGLEYVENEEGQLEIEYLEPGSTAWNCGKLNKGDILLKIKTQQGGEIDLTDANEAELADILYSDSYQKIEISVKKADATFENVWLTKEKVVTEENVVHSLVLKGAKKIGYIYLPGFYQGRNGRLVNGCANDVAKEILKLKEEGVEGLIFDIRYNGGGSLHEGLDLAGIFVNEGPLSIINMRGDKPRIKLDPNRGTIWEGPLLVMVNGESASASEVLASTLKDYNRALIVGSRTFGKATGQVMMPIDTTGRDRWGQVLVTIEKLYRVTGKSVQAKGLVPDILLPDADSLFSEKESDYLMVLPSDSVIKEVRYTKLIAPPIYKLAEKSQQRIAENAGFHSVKAFSLALSEDVPNMVVPLEFSTYRKARKEREEVIERYEQAMAQKTAHYEVKNHTFDKNILKDNAIRKESNEAFIRTVESDIYVEECYKIMQDWLGN